MSEWRRIERASRTKKGRACFDFRLSVSLSLLTRQNFVSSMAYPPVPYPPLLSASPATTAASSERANPASPAPSRDHASSSSIAPSPSSLSLSRSPATSVPQESPQASSSVTEPSSPLSQLSKLSTPFRFPRPTYSPDTPASPPRLTLVTETAHDFLQKLMRTRTLESPVRESGEKSEFATKYPGQFGTFKTPTKSNMGEVEPEGGEETGKRKKRKRVEGSLVKDGSSLEGIDHSRYALVHVPWPKKCVCGD